jgi:MFS family permease
MTKRFYGWWITFAAVLTFGISVGLPYYNMPFFYDYYSKAFGWSRSDITLGFPLAAVLTLWVGPLIIPKFSPRKLIVVGTGLTFLSFLGFGLMGASLPWYYFLWFVYTVGYILSGPIPHQIVISHWFRKKRGISMGIVYVGVGLVGALGAKLVKPMTEGFDFHKALIIIGAVMFLAWPFAIFILRDKPSEMNQFPDGDAEAPAEQKIEAKSMRYLLGQWTFWMLLIGSLCSIGAIGAVNFHMKLVFQDAFKNSGVTGPAAQGQLNSLWSTAQFGILISSIVGRLLIGKFADMFPMKYVMTVTYFIVAASIPLLLHVTPGSDPYVFSIVFGFAMGADYMLIPLMAAKQFGVNSLARAMAVILPVNTIGQTWVPYGVSFLRDHYGSYETAMSAVLGLAVIGAISIAVLPKGDAEDTTPSKPLPQASQA